MGQIIDGQWVPDHKVEAFIASRPEREAHKAAVEAAEAEALLEADVDQALSDLHECSGYCHPAKQPPEGTILVLVPLGVLAQNDLGEPDENGWYAFAPLAEEQDESTPAPDGDQSPDTTTPDGADKEPDTEPDGAAPSGATEPVQGGPEAPPAPETAEDAAKAARTAARDARKAARAARTK